MGAISVRINSDGNEAVDFAPSIGPHTEGPGRSIERHGRPSSSVGKEDQLCRAHYFETANPSAVEQSRDTGARL